MALFGPILLYCTQHICGAKRKKLQVAYKDALRIPLSYLSKTDNRKTFVCCSKEVYLQFYIALYRVTQWSSYVIMAVIVP